MTNHGRSKNKFRLQAEVRHNCQRYFVEYVNKLVPELAESLKALTLHCQNLLGQNPQKIDVPNALFFSPIFTECVYKETRYQYGSYHCLNRLNEFDNELHTHSEYRTEIQKKLDEKIEKHFNENFNDVDSTQTLNSYKQHNYNEYSRVFYIMYQKILESDQKLRDAEDYILKKLDFLTQFQNSFDAITEKFNLTKHWLSYSVFIAILDGTGVLKTGNSYSESYSNEILDEIEQKLADETKFSRSEDQYRKKIFMSNVFLPRPSPFHFTEYFWLMMPFEEYEDKAVEAYRQHLLQYFEIIKETLVKHGYKQVKKSYDYKRIKWLVRYSIQGWSKNNILEELQLENVNNPNDISTIDKAFRKFMKYDLPVKRGTN